MANILAALPKSAHPGAKNALAEIYNAEDRGHAEQVAKVFADDYGAKWPKAVAKLTDDLDTLLAFYDFPAEHWVHLLAVTALGGPGVTEKCGPTCDTPGVA